MDVKELAVIGQKALQEKYKLSNKKSKSNYFKVLAQKSVDSRKAKKLASEQNTIGS